MYVYKMQAKFFIYFIINFPFFFCSKNLAQDNFNKKVDHESPQSERFLMILINS